MIDLVGCTTLSTTSFNTDGLAKALPLSVFGVTDGMTPLSFNACEGEVA